MSKNDVNNIIILLISGMLIACQSTPEAPYYSQRSIIQVANPSVNLSELKSFSIVSNPNLFHVGNDYDAVKVSYMLERELKRQLSKKGYQYISSPNIADFYVTFTLAIEDGVTDIHINDQLGLNPGFNQSSHNLNRYKKGTLILDVIERKTRYSAYRSAIQGFAHLKLTAKEREYRIGRVVSNLISGVPNRQ